MADFIFNISKGNIKNLAGLPLTNDAIIAVLVKASGLETDSTLKDYADLSTLLAGTTDECDFTNYARKTITANLSSTVDNTNDWYNLDLTVDPVWTAAGGATNNSVGAVIFCYDNDTTSGTDSNIVPISKHDLTFTTDGTDVTVVINTAGLWRAA